MVARLALDELWEMASGAVGRRRGKDAGGKGGDGSEDGGDLHFDVLVGVVVGYLDVVADECVMRQRCFGMLIWVSRSRGSRWPLYFIRWLDTCRL